MALDIGNEVDEQNGMLLSVLLCPRDGNDSQGGHYVLSLSVCLFVRMSICCHTLKMFV